ncbi:MAG: ABC transporter ATP-binding protein [bacterium]|jgi:oligopeptide/dipeptide ABC transporter ATP-binding protein
MAEKLLSVRELKIDFNTSAGVVSAVDGVNFDIQAGEIFALVGESGCGKSTTAFGLMRLVPAPGEITGGSIEFAGQDLLQMSEEAMTGIRGKEIGMIFQNPLDSLNPVYSVGQQIAESIRLDNVPKEEAWKKVTEILGNVKIADAAHRRGSFPHELSGGMRQRVMIGMMLSRRPQLLIADEPTTALDVTIQAQILELIRELKNKLNMAVLVITHDFGIVSEIADRVGVMYAGKIVETGDVYQVFENPRHPYTKLLLRALPRITKREGRLETIPGFVPNLAAPPPGCRFHPRCPEATPACRESEPPLRDAGAGHRYACRREVG